MIAERRRSGWSGALVLRATLAWALVAILLLATHWANIAARRFPDPDDILRLVQLRDLLAGQHWFDLIQYRLDAPHGGVPMHWSRLVDIPLLLVVGALTPFLGAVQAEMFAMVAVPLLTLFLAIMHTHPRYARASKEAAGHRPHRVDHGHEFDQPRV